MPKAFTDNVAGHRSKYEILAATLPPEEVGISYVGGSDPVLTGYSQLELIRAFVDLHGASVVDIGCGIGRLTRHLIDEKIKDYLGTDVVPEIMKEASNFAAGDLRFKFRIVHDFRIPKKDATATVVVAFSVITHMLDEEAFEYIQEARRVLSLGGVALFSFLDFLDEAHLDSFFLHASHHRYGHGDMLKFTTKDVLERFAKRAGFTRVEFISGSTELRVSGSPSKLLDVAEARQTYSMGQSVCAMTV
jgi:SAM-dependent methyltransferase